MYLEEYLKQDSKEFVYKEYVTRCFNIMVQGATIKKPLDDLLKIYEKIENRNKKQDERTAEQIEQDIINKFKGAWG